MKKLLLFVFILCTSGLLSAQNWNWSKSAGGSGATDKPYDIYVDPSGNSYVIGTFNPSITLGSFTLTCNPGEVSTFVAKYDPSGTVLWAKMITNLNGGENFGYSIWANASGECFVTGTFFSKIGFGSLAPITTTGTHDYDIFVAKYSATGVETWAKRYGGNSIDIGRKITVDAAGFVYLTGNLGSGSVTFGSLAAVTGDFFVLRVNPTTGAAVWVKAGTGSSDVVDLKYDPSGTRLILYGDFVNTKLTIGSHTINNPLASPQPFKVFLISFDASSASTGTVQWLANSTGGSGYSTTMDVDVSGNIVISGLYPDNVIFTNTVTNTTTTLTGGGTFLTKYDATGTLVWSERLTDQESNNDLDTDCSGNIYITSSFPGSITIAGLSSTGSSGLYVTKVNTSGIGKWIVTASGAGPTAIGLDGTADVYVTGAFSGTVTFPPVSSMTAISQDVFLAKLTPPVPVDPVVDDITICNTSNNSVTLTITNPMPSSYGFVYNWYANATTTTPLSGGSNTISYTTNAWITTTTDYYVQAINTLSCGPNSNRVKVTVTIINTVPSVPSISNPPLICTNEGSAVLTVSPANPSYTYRWYTVATGGTPIYTSTTSGGISTYTTPILNATTTYYVESYSTAIGFCPPYNSARVPVTVTVDNSCCAPFSPSITSNPTTTVNVGISMTYYLALYNPGSSDITVTSIDVLLTAGAYSGTTTTTFPLLIPAGQTVTVNYSGSYPNSGTFNQCFRVNIGDGSNCKYDLCSPIEVDPPLGIRQGNIEDNAITQEATISPIPFTDETALLVSSSEKEAVPYSVTIVDALGRMVSKIEGLKMNNKNMIGRELSSGIYMAIVKYGDKTEYIRIIKN